MKKLNIMDIALSTFAFGILGMDFVFEKSFEFFEKCGMDKITEIEKLDNSIVFKNRQRCLFVLEKNGKYAVDISNNVITFLYFGCAAKNDCHKFRILHEISEKLKTILIPSNLTHEQGLYRLQ